MTSPDAALRLDVATGLHPGTRGAQEDAVLADMPQGGAAGLVALADGLGGHAGGALASRIAVTTALQDLAGRRDTSGRLPGDVAPLLRRSAEAANAAVLARAAQTPDLAGMGTTLVLLAVQDDRLHWCSVGDSPLWLVRDGQARRLNETHSLSVQLDLLVAVGEMSAEEAAGHPGRACLTSALGADPIAQVDCPAASLRLIAGDVVIAASDGVLTLPEARVGALAAAGDGSAARLAADLLAAVQGARAPDQDNVSVAVLRAEAAAPARPATGARAPWPRRLFAGGRGGAAAGPARGLAAAARVVAPLAALRGGGAE